jgi:hypothetical protein
MAGLVPAIHVLLLAKQDVDARHKAGHDVESAFRKGKAIAQPMNFRRRSRSRTHRA